MEMWLTIGKVGPTNSSNSLKLRGVSRCVHPEALLDCEHIEKLAVKRNTRYSVIA